MRGEEQVRVIEGLMKHLDDGNLAPRPVRGGPAD